MVQAPQVTPLFSSAQWAEGLTGYRHGYERGKGYVCVPAWIFGQLLDDMALLEKQLHLALQSKEEGN